MTETASADITLLIDRLTAQRELYQQLKTLSDQQNTLIETGETEQLLSVLSQRQVLVDQLGQLNSEIAPIRQRWPVLSESLSSRQRDHVNDLLEQVESLLQSIIEQDDRDRQNLQAAKQQVVSEVKQVNHAGRAVNAYRAAPQASPSAARFTDRQG